MGGEWEKNVTKIDDPNDTKIKKKKTKIVIYSPFIYWFF